MKVEAKGFMLWIFTVCWILAWFLTLGVYGLSLLTETESDEDLLEEELVSKLNESRIVRVQNVGYNRSYTINGRRPTRSLPAWDPTLPRFGDEESLESIYDEGVGRVSSQKQRIPAKALDKEVGQWKDLGLEGFNAKSGNCAAQLSSVEVSGNGVRVSGLGAKPKARTLRIRDKKSGEVIGVLILKDKAGKGWRV